MGIFHVTLYISSSLFYFIVLLLIMRSQPTFFSISWLVSNHAKHDILDNWSKQCTLEVSVMVTELVSNTILFLAKKLCWWNENVNTFHKSLRKALLCTLFNFDQVSFYVVVWPVWLMLHNFVSVLAYFIIFMSLVFDCRG